MKNLLLSAAAIALWAGTANSANTYTSVSDGTLSGASPNGKYAVGYNPNYNVYNVYMESFIYDADSQKVEWFTEYNEEDLSTGGYFSGISDNGIVCGVSKDMDNLITWFDYIMNEEFDGPTNVATIWENGKAVKLPYGNIDPTELEYLEDGTFAIAISADGNTVVGSIGTGNGAIYQPCFWTRGTDGVWNMTELSYPSTAKNFSLKAVSADGKTIVGSAYVNDKPKAIFWKEGVFNIIEGPAQADPNAFVNVQTLNVSPDGRFIVMSHSSQGLIYDTAENTYRFIPRFDEMDQMAFSAVIDNSGNVYSGYNGWPVSHPFVYLYESDRTLDLNYYLGIVDPELRDKAAFSSMAQFISISEDGKHFAGNTSSFMGSGWVMHLDAENITVPETPEFTYASSRNLREVTLRWNKGQTVCADYNLTGYRVLNGDKSIAEVAADKDEFELILPDQQTGYPSYSLVAVFENANGNTLESPTSKAVSVAVAPDYSLPFFEGFDMSMETNYWTQTRDYGSALEATWSCFGGAGVQNGMGAYSTISDRKPYSFSIESRPFDASDENYVTVSFGANHAMLNDNNQILDTDYISVEVSTDMGDNWTTIRTWKLSEMATGNWTFKTLDLSEAVAGKIFKVRIRRHGEGNGMYIAGLDNVAVNIANELAAPSCLAGMLNSDGSASFIWKSLSGAFNLNKLGYLRTQNLTFGNEGREMIVANKYTPQQLALYKGKYITSISAPFEFQSWYDEVLGIHATAMIFEDGKVVREQEFDPIEYNTYNVVDLDEPYLIDDSKEIMVAVKIHDYDAEQWPLVAATADDFVKGMTDLYSEDGGKTWECASEFFDAEDIRSFIIWDITAHVTDTDEPAEIDYSALPLYQQVNRDGEIANIVALDGNAANYVDRNAYENAAYTVVAHGFDGSISDFSNVFTLTATGIMSVVNGSEGISFAAATGDVTVEGECLRLTVFAADGSVVAGAEGNSVNVNGLPGGVYFVNAETPQGMKSAKIFIR